MTPSTTITSRPVVYVALGWFLVALAGVMFVLVLCFPKPPQPQYPDAITNEQALFLFPGPILCIGALLLWSGYRSCVVADESGLRWKKGRMWQRVAWEDVASRAFQHEEANHKSRWIVTGRNGEQVVWWTDWSNRALLKEFVARQLGAGDEGWAVRFVYGEERWWEKWGSWLGSLGWGMMGLPFLYMLVVWWKTMWEPLPHHWLVAVLVLVLVGACWRVAFLMLRLSLSQGRIEEQHRNESIEIRGETLIWSNGLERWEARLEEVRLIRERNGDWRFETPQGQFTVERLVRWRLALRARLEHQGVHLRVEEEDEANLWFGFDTTTNKFLAAMPSLVMVLGPVGGVLLARIMFPDPDGPPSFDLWGLLLSLSIPVSLSLLGFYTCKLMAYEVREEGLWRRGFWGKGQLMRWEDITEIGAMRSGGVVTGVVDGRSVRWELSPLFTVERPFVLQRLIAERAPHAARSSAEG